MNRFIALDSWREYAPASSVFSSLRKPHSVMHLIPNWCAIRICSSISFLSERLVIAYNYQAKIRNGWYNQIYVPVYPLHIVMLIVVIAFTAAGGRCS
jgi:hypothetical protein